MSNHQWDVSEFHEFIEEEEYDTESLEYDIGFTANMDGIESTNIAIKFENNLAANIRKFFYFSKCM